MDHTIPTENDPSFEPQPAAEILALLQAQLALGDSLSSTSQFLRFALSLARENLDAINSQLETIRDMTEEMGGQDAPDTRQ